MIFDIALILSVFTFLGLFYVGFRFFKARAKNFHLSANQDPMLLKLQPKISWCRYLENIGDYGIKLSSQYKTIINVQKSSFNVLRQKFNMHEITYTRYQQSIDSTNHLLVDNVMRLIPLLETFDTITASELVNKKEFIEEIDVIFVMNEQLLEKLNALIINLSHLKSLAGLDETATQYLLENLDKLIERAKYY